MFSEKNGNIKALYLIIGIFVIGGFLNFAITPTVTSDTYEDKHIKLEFPLGFHEEEAEPGLKQYVSGDAVVTIRKDNLNYSKKAYFSNGSWSDFIKSRERAGYNFLMESPRTEVINLKKFYYMQFGYTRYGQEGNVHIFATYVDNLQYMFVFTGNFSKKRAKSVLADLETV